MWIFTVVLVGLQVVSAVVCRGAEHSTKRIVVRYLSHNAILANYRAFTHREIIVVFDAYNVKGGEEHKEEIDGLHVVFTKEGELADTYIERLIYEIGKDQNVRAVTSDGLIQLQAVRSGVLRLSAKEFREEVLAVDADIADYLRKLREGRG